MVEPTHVGLFLIDLISDRTIVEHAHDLAKPNLCCSFSICPLLLEILSRFVFAWTDDNTVPDKKYLSINLNSTIASSTSVLPRALA